MRLKRYDINQHDETTFWFVSKGIKGEITKAVIFDAMDEPHRYNLGMGDWIQQTGEIEDKELSGNGDARKVLQRSPIS